MSTERAPATAPQTQTPVENPRRPYNGGRRAVAAGAVALAAAGGLMLSKGNGETTDTAYTSIETAAPALAIEIMDLYTGDIDVTPSIEPAGEDGSEIIKARYQSPGPAEENGQPGVSTEYSLYIQVPNAREALADRQVTADEIISVNVQVAHVLDNEYLPTTPYAASIMHEGGEWTVSVAGTAEGEQWSLYGTGDPEALPEGMELYGAEPISDQESQSAVFNQMHTIIQNAQNRAPLSEIERPY